MVYNHPGVSGGPQVPSFHPTRTLEGNWILEGGLGGGVQLVHPHWLKEGSSRETRTLVMRLPCTHRVREDQLIFSGTSESFPTTVTFFHGPQLCKSRAWQGVTPDPDRDYKRESRWDFFPWESSAMAKGGWDFKLREMLCCADLGGMDSSCLLP